MPTDTTPTTTPEPGSICWVTTKHIKAGDLLGQGPAPRKGSADLKAIVWTLVTEKLALPCSVTYVLADGSTRGGGVATKFWRATPIAQAAVLVLGTTADRYPAALAAKKAKAPRGKGLPISQPSLAEYISAVLAAQPDAKAGQALEVAYYLDGLALGRTRWMAAWAQATA